MLQPLDFDLLNELVEISVILHTQKIVDDSGSIAVPLLFHGYSSLLYCLFHHLFDPLLLFIRIENKIVLVADCNRSVIVESKVLLLRQFAGVNRLAYEVYRFLFSGKLLPNVQAHHVIIESIRISN